LPYFDEDRVVAGLVIGDSDAADAFATEFEPKIRRAVWAAGVPAADVPDTTQEVLIDAIRQLSKGQFAGKAALATWLRRIIAGKVADYWRAASRQRRTSIVSLETVELDSECLSTVAEQEARLAAQEALDAMTARQCFALAVCYRLGEPVEELARLLNVSPKRAYGILNEAKHVFRSHVVGTEKKNTTRRLAKKRSEK
jgi:RNA polymerase sigma factor (sigma-70 family)